MSGIVLYLILAGVPMLLGAFAQFSLRSAVRAGNQTPTELTGAEAARQMLDHAGLQNVEIERIGGFLTDHYDPSAKVLRLSQDIYDQRNATAVGVACHEAGHAIQDASHYAPLVIRNIAVPAASIGSNIGLGMFILGMFLHFTTLIWLGIILFSLVVIFQIINLPVEFNASSRAKVFLYNMHFVNEEGASRVRAALYAAAMTYVAATVQAIGTLFYYILLAASNRDSQ